MTNNQILEKAIEKAEKGGYFLQDEWRLLEESVDAGQLAGHLPFDDVWFYGIIFSHDFAKAFWGEEKLEMENPKGEKMVLDRPLWQFCLQEMVLDKNPLKYIEMYLKND